MRPLEEITNNRKIHIEESSYHPEIPAFGGRYFDSINHKYYNFIFSVQGGWEHLSVSTPSKTPSWDIMCEMKEAFFDDEEECFEFHPKKSEYINVHQHCLHIWRPVISDILNMYSSQGLCTIGEKITTRDLLKDLFKDNDKLMNQLEDFYKAENGENINLDEEIQLIDRVPIELIGRLNPPYLSVGTKTKEGFNTLKDIAKENNIKVGLGDN